MHAIDDHANTIALNAFERVGCTGRIEDAQLVRPGDPVRCARRGLIISVQPQHPMSDRDVADRHWPDRTRSVSVGDPDDLVLLPEDPAHLSNHDLRNHPVLATLVAGRFIRRPGKR